MISDTRKPTLSELTRRLVSLLAWLEDVDEDNAMFAELVGDPRWDQVDPETADWLTLAALSTRLQTSISLLRALWQLEDKVAERAIQGLVNSRLLLLEVDGSGGLPVAPGTDLTLQDVVAWCDPQGDVLEGRRLVGKHLCLAVAAAEGTLVIALRPLHETVQNDLEMLQRYPEMLTRWIERERERGFEIGLSSAGSLVADQIYQMVLRPVVAAFSPLPDYTVDDARARSEDPDYRHAPFHTAERTAEQWMRLHDSDLADTLLAARTSAQRLKIAAEVDDLAVAASRFISWAPDLMRGPDALLELGFDHQGLPVGYDEDEVLRRPIWMLGLQDHPIHDSLPLNAPIRAALESRAELPDQAFRQLKKAAHVLLAEARCQAWQPHFAANSMAGDWLSDYNKVIEVLQTHFDPRVFDVPLLALSPSNRTAIKRVAGVLEIAMETLSVADLPEEHGELLHMPRIGLGTMDGIKQALGAVFRGWRAIFRPGVVGVRQTKSEELGSGLQALGEMFR